jgi:hypothetical protein
MVASFAGAERPRVHRGARGPVAATPVIDAVRMIDTVCMIGGDCMISA